MVDVYAVKIVTNIDIKSFNLLKKYISFNKKQRIERYRRFEDAQRSLVGELLIRFLICKNLNVYNKNITFSSNQYGKPELLHHDHFHYNISHSDNLVVCCIHSLPVGIDVEKIQDFDSSIAKHFFSIDEYNYILNSENFNKNDLFFRIWCAKESYIKALGKGLFIPLDSFSIKVVDENISLKENNAANNANKFSFKEYKLSSKYMIVACGQSITFSDVHYIQLNDLINFFAGIPA